MSMTPIGGLDHVQVVFDHHHGVAAIDEPMKDGQELLYVGEVQSRGGLIERQLIPIGSLPVRKGSRPSITSGHGSIATGGHGPAARAGPRTSNP
jgi:hypothetical protein